MMMAIASVNWKKLILLLILTTIYQSENNWAATTSSGSEISARNPRHGCKAPELTLNGVPVLARQSATPNYHALTEIRFAAQLPNTIVKEMPRDCKIKCIDGDWIGPLCQNIQSGRYRPVLRNCAITLKNDSGYDIMINDIPLDSYDGLCPDHTVVKLKCKGNPGYYKQHGSIYTVCIDGSWTDQLPTCIPTTVMTNYSESSPPTITYNLSTGSMVVDDDNRLVLFPGSTLHLECHYNRQKGTPSWDWTNGAASNYTMGWNKNVSTYDWKYQYRLSIAYINPEDAGEFICTTPHQRTNSINIRIAEIYCKEADFSRHKYVIIKVNGKKLGEKIQYSCKEGYELIGASTATCLESGDWSNELPECKPVMCPDVYYVESYLIMESYNTMFGSEIEFSCHFGYKLVGQKKIRCGPDGQWSDKVPTCKEVLCPTPAIPENGNLIEQTGNGKYMYGIILQFACKSNFELQGVETVTCDEDGTWSDSMPTCEPRCQYPGEPDHGRIFPLEFQYNPGSEITVECDPGYIVLTTQNITCLENGQWSHSLPKCTFYTEIIY